MGAVGGTPWGPMFPIINEKPFPGEVQKGTSFPRGAGFRQAVFDFHFHCYLHQKRAKMNPSADLADPGDPGDAGDLVHGLQLGTSPTRAGGQDDVSSN